MASKAQADLNLCIKVCYCLLSEQMFVIVYNPYLHLTLANQHHEEDFTPAHHSSDWSAGLESGVIIWVIQG